MVVANIGSPIGVAGAGGVILPASSASAASVANWLADELSSGAAAAATSATLCVGAGSSLELLLLFPVGAVSVPEVSRWLAA